ncbi:MAG: GIY-YIG nuclease family protein [Candidatus Bathyarchaeota archaeon]|nr:GIY-YIG nuclease family protein [Candidatus Termiticorpusculum sp.]
MKGIYVLIIKINASKKLKIGALGEIVFSAGLYAYVGSAQGGIESRVKRHMRKEKRLFWHIDYLLADDAVEVVQIYCLVGDKMCECQTAQLLDRHSEAILNFGCSDCHCSSHLFSSDNFAFLKDHMKPLALPGYNLNLTHRI